jgi:hypothetical protein
MESLYHVSESHGMSNTKNKLLLTWKGTVMYSRKIKLPNYIRDHNLTAWLI